MNQQPVDPRALRVIGLALVFGAVGFAIIAVALGLGLGGAAPDQAADGNGDSAALPFHILSWVLVPVTLVGLGIASILPRRAGAAESGNLAGVFITRWAMLEGAALFGTVIVLLAGLDGRIPESPYLYLCLLPTALFAVIVVLDLRRLNLV